MASIAGMALMSALLAFGLNTGLGSLSAAAIILFIVRPDLGPEEILKTRYHTLSAWAQSLFCSCQRLSLRQ